MKKSKGFTLIELMVVVVILGILAVVVAPRIPDLVKKAQEGATKGALATMRSTLNIYYSDQEGFYPVTSVNTTVTDEMNAVLVPKYIKKIPDIRIPTAHPGTTISGVYGYPSIPTASGSVQNDGSNAWGYCGQPTITVGGQTTANPDYGNIIVNCGHNDTKGNPWLSY
jgi:prepilin-type N-terminal cleavage/methylation domain-containing protein